MNVALNEERDIDVVATRSDEPGRTMHEACLHISYLLAFHGCTISKYFN